MTYAYAIVIYVSYIQIYYYCLLGQGLPQDLWREIFVHYDFLSYFIYYKMSVKFLMNLCIYHTIAKSYTLPLDHKETPSIVLLSFASFSYISL